MYELLFDSKELIRKFEMFYQDWKVLKQTIVPYRLEMTRNEEKVLLESNVVTWVTQKKGTR